MSVRCPPLQRHGNHTVRLGPVRGGHAARRAGGVYGMSDRLTEFAAGRMGVATEAIADLVARLAAALQRMERQNGQIVPSGVLLATQELERPHVGQSPEPKGHRRMPGRCAAGEGGPPREGRRHAEKGPPPVPRRDGKARDRREAQGYGGRPRHGGRSRTDKPEGTMRLAAPPRINCGTAPGVIVKTMRVRGHGLNRRSGASYARRT